MKKLTYTLLLTISITQLYSQSSTFGIGLPGHTGVAGGTHFLGWLNNVIPLNFQTAGIERMRINQNIPAQITTAPAGTQNTDGFIGIGLNPALQAPWSRLHIGIPSGPFSNAPYGGYRAWMREGLTLQSANDQLWLVI